MSKPDVDDVEAERFLKAVANRHRLRILRLLCQSERSVGELEKLVGLEQSNLSRHLAVLRNENLVSTRRDGVVIHYSLTSTPARSFIEMIPGILAS